MRHVLRPITYWGRALRLIRAAAPGWTALWLALLVAQGLLPAAPVYLSRPLVDSLVASAGSGGGWAHVRPVALSGALMIAALVLTAALHSVIEWVRAVQAELVNDHISALVHRQSAAVDLAFYEAAEYHDRLDQARSEAGTRSLALLESAGGLLQNTITLLTMAAILVPYGAWLPLLLLASTAPALAVVLLFDRRLHAWWERATSRRRRAQYYQMLLTDGYSAAELRLFGLGELFHQRFRALRQGLRGERLALLGQQSAARFGAALVGTAVGGGALAWMALRMLAGQITLGDLALFVQAFQRGEGLMRALLSGVGQLYQNSLFLGNLFAFLDLRPQVVAPAAPVPLPAPIRGGVRFRDVTFRYPGAERPALERFDLALPAGQIVAIVGANGAGKSTLVKLLCRFYDPDSGAVEIDGVDLRRIALDELRRNISVLFQFPFTYQESAAENIVFGDHGAAPGRAAVEAAARAAGAHELIAGLPRGYDTLLGRWFAGGVELSGGEWQRIAMARAFLRQAPVIALDEPTSFMDSWAEADWFDRFRALAHGRTALIITHRFTIAMRADIIHVMDGGRIVESGSHHDLLARGGRYAESWGRQMRAAASPAEEVDVTT